MKLGFLYSIIGLLLLSVPLMIQSSQKLWTVPPVKKTDYKIIKHEIVQRCRHCDGIDLAIVDLETTRTIPRTILGLVTRRAFNVDVYQAGSCNDRQPYYSFKYPASVPRFVYGPTDGAVMAACVGIVALQHRDEVAQVAKNAAQATNKLARNVYSSAKALIKSKL